MTRLVLLPLILTLLLFSCGPQPDSAETSDRPVPDTVTIHERFNFTETDFGIRLDGLGDQALADPNGFLELTAGMLQMPREYLILVDKNHALSPDFRPVDPVDLASFPEINRGRDDLYLDFTAAEAFGRLSEAAESDGINLIVSSAYRSFEYQRGLFSRFVERDGEAAASRYSARAGTSQHQLGTTVDLGDVTNAFAGTASGIWMEDNAGDFGWSLSYPPGLEEETGYMWESWHWRWIGADAVRMQNLYFDGLQQRMLVFWERNAPRLREAVVD